MVGGQLGGQHALIDQLLHQRMILCDLLKIAVPEEVGAAVADLCDVDLFGSGPQQGERGAHAGEASVVLLLEVQAAVDGLHGEAEHFRVGVFTAQDTRQSVPGACGRDLAALMPAHAIRDAPKLLHYHKRVLIIRSQLSHIRSTNSNHGKLSLQ